MGRSTGSGNNFLQVVANNFDVLALPLVTLVFPLYASIRAIETKSRTDDQQWLTYWVLYSLITLFEMTFAKVLECFPIWAYAKLIVTCWLVLPQFNGAAYVYRRFIRPFYMNPQIITNGQQIWYFPRTKDKKNIFSKPDDVLTAAEKYMEEHGTEAFERLITKTDREARARRSNNYMIFDDDYTLLQKLNQTTPFRRRIIVFRRLIDFYFFGRRFYKICRLMWNYELVQKTFKDRTVV